MVVVAEVVARVVGGIAVGAVVPLVAVWLYERRLFEATKPLEPIFALSVMLLAWSIARTTGANALLASFAAGGVLGNMSRTLRERWSEPGETVTEVTKLTAVFLFGATVARTHFAAIGWREALFAATALLVARPAALLLAMVGARLDRRERLVLAWFGPRGFASIVFALLIQTSGIRDAERWFTAIAVVVAVSIVAHSTTDTLAVRAFDAQPGSR